MKPNISEFSYGYAIIDELIHWHGYPITAAPVFPSLYQEGQNGGGWDVQLKRDSGIPLFLQFKLSDWMRRSNAQERRNGKFRAPYYRMFIRKRNHSRQHEMLLELESYGNEVYYVAPCFHELHELNEAYINHRIRARSIWIRPANLGRITDDEQHYVSFDDTGTCYFCSEPKKISESSTFNNISSKILGLLKEEDSKEEGSKKLNRENLEALAKTMENIGGKKSRTSSKEIRDISEKLADRHPIERVAYYALTYFDSQLVLVNHANHF